ncbi:MAG: glycosyltransferase [Candidatus Pacebacteria bacterium]|nr:glycosyltransferase [Candidatus Paceibacterota bacterium]
MANFKKTLIVSSYAPPSMRGAPQNIYNLFRDFPPSFYCFLTSYYNIDNISAQKGNWLQGKYIFYDNLSFSGSLKDRPEIIKERQSRSILDKLKYLIKRIWVLGFLSGIFIIGSQIISIVRSGIKNIKKEKIEIMIGFSDYGPALISTYLLHKITKKPYYIFLFDIYKDNFYPVFPAASLAKIFESKILKNAEKIIVTNEGTLNYYAQIYGEEIRKKIVVIHNSTFPESYLKLHTGYCPKSPYSIVFTGNIYWAQSKSIKNLIQAIKEINDLDIYFKIYCPNPKAYLNKIGITENKKVQILIAQPEKMPEIQTQADILFLPLSWHKKGRKIIDTATPGKLADYLISNRPILIHAPSSTFLVKYAKENNFAVIVDEENIEKLKIAIKKLLTDQKFVEGLIDNAKKTFFKNHDSNKNSLFFQSLFK